MPVSDLLQGVVPWPDDIARRDRQRGYWRGVQVYDRLPATEVGKISKAARREGVRCRLEAEVTRTS